MMMAGNLQLWHLNAQMPYLFLGNTDWAKEPTGLRALGEQEVAARGRGRPEKGEKGKTMLLLREGESELNNEWAKPWGARE